MVTQKNSIENSNETLLVNGLKYEYQPPMNVLNLLQYFGFNTNIIVVDYNGTILSKSRWQKTNLKQNDSLEILTIAGGG